MISVRGFLMQLSHSRHRLAPNLDLLRGAIVVCCWLLPLAVCRSLPASSFPSDEQVRYLMKYGYLALSDMETQQQRSAGELRAAVSHLQQMAGMRPTGTFDADTVALMIKPRCGVQDLSAAALTRISDPESFRLNHGRWTNTDLTYRLLNNPGELGYTEAWWDIKKAFDLWSNVSALTFRDVGRSSPPADIDVSFEVRQHLDGSPFDGPGYVLAHAFPPGYGRGGDVHFDDDERWTTSTTRLSGSTNLFSVAAHEIGHALGISHSSVPGSLMFAWYNGDNPTLAIHADDINAIQHLYGPRSPSSGHPAVTIPPHAGDFASTPPPGNWRLCQLDAVTNLRGEVFAIQSQQAWQMNTAGHLKSKDYIPVSSMWRLPTALDAIDAMFERPGDGVVVIFRGRRFWEFTRSQLVAGFPVDGRPLTSLGISERVQRIDAAVVGLGYLNRRTYLFSGYEYWRLRDSASMVVDEFYPQQISQVFRGIPNHVDAAFTDVNGEMYFFKNDEYYLFNGAKLEIESGYPKQIAHKWGFCSETIRLSSASILHHHESSYVTRLLLCTLLFLHHVLL